MIAKNLKSSILQYAMQGKLIPQEINEDLAINLLDHIFIKKEEKKIPSIKIEEIPFDIPESWAWVSLEDIASITGGYAFKSSDYTKDGVRVIRISDFNEKGFINNKIVRHVFNESYKNFLIEKENILLCMTGGTVGKSLFVQDLNEPMMTNQRVATIKVNPVVVPEFVNFAILSPAVQAIITNSKNSTNDNISMNTIKKFPIPLPPIEEQKRIVNKIKELFVEIDSYDNHYLALEALNKRFPKDLEKSILQYAIEGKLVEQDTSDEPASELLKRISEQKEQMVKEKIIKKEKALPPIIEEEIPFDIPETWEWVRLGSIFNVNPRNTVDDNLSVSFMPMSLLDEGYRNSFTFEIRKWQDVKKGYTHFRNGDLLIAKITPCFQNLKSAIASDLENGFGAGTTELHVLRPYIDLHLPYFLWFVKSPSFVADCVKNMSGTAGQQRVGKSYIQNYLVPVPPLEEQIRIANNIEQFLKSTNLLKN